MSPRSRILLSLALVTAALSLPVRPAFAVTDADLGLSIAHAPASVPAGEDVTFSFEVVNNGPGRATAVHVEYGLAGGQVIGSSGNIGRGNADGGRYLVGITGGLEPDEVRPFTLTVRAEGGRDAVIDATVSGYEPDPVASNDAETETVPVTPALRGVWKRERPWSEPMSRWGSGYAFHETMIPEPAGQGVAFGGLFISDTSVDVSRGTRMWGGGWSATEDGGSNSDPPARFLAAMAYYPADETIVLFGGVGQTGLLDDTWVLRKDRSWAKKTPATRPPARAGAGLAFVGGKLVLFGGDGQDAPLNDTWTWNGSNWAKVTTTPSPPARSEAVLVGDIARDRAVLFGGCCDSSDRLLGDTWTFDGSAWTRQSPATSPSARIDAVAAFDRSARRVALFGGMDEDGTDLGDLWVWTGSTWGPVATTGETPPARDGGVMFFAAGTRSDPGRLLLYGGTDDNGDLLDDTWTILLPGPSAVVSPSSHAFGSVPVGGTSAAKTVRVDNQGSEPLTVSSVTLGGSGASSFRADATGCAAPLAPGTGCDVAVRMTPSGSGARAATLTVATDGDVPASVSLSGTGATASLVVPPLVSAASVNHSFNVSWSPSAPGMVFDVEYMERYRTSSGAYADGTWRRWKTGVAAGNAWFGGSGQPASVPGHTYLFRVRARNGSATGSWTPLKSAVVPVDDRSNWLGWSSQSVSGRYFATLRTGTSAKQWMTLTTDTNMFTVVGERCAACGQFRVYVDGAQVATVDTYARSTAARQTLYSRYLPGGIKRHSIKIVPVGTARRPSVKIDAVALAR